MIKTADFPSITLMALPIFKLLLVGDLSGVFCM